MFKKYTSCVLCILLIVFCIFVQRQPVFSAYANTYQVYFADSYASSKSLRVDKNNYKFLSAIKGESVVVSCENFKLNQFLNEFGAKIIVTEKIAEGTSYYAYSPKINYLECIYGEKINLQIFVADSYIVLGTPIIYGSF